MHTWCEAHRDELTQGGKVKYHDFPSGHVAWRMRPPRVVVRNLEKVLEALRTLGLSQFIRVKEEVNKEAVLAEPDVVAQVRGISIAQEEDFGITPFETKLEEVA